MVIIARNYVTSVYLGMMVLLLMISPESYASGTESLVNEKILSLEQKIIGWRTEAIVVGSLVVIIAVSGAIVSLAQGFDHPYSSKVLVFLGVLVVLVVAVQEQFYPNSRKEITKLVNSAEKAIEEVKFDLAQPNRENRSSNFYLDLRKKLDIVSADLSGRLYGGLWFISDVYSQSEFCGSKDTKNEYICFQGEARGKDIIRTELVAIENAKNNAIQSYISYLFTSVSATEEELSEIDFLYALEGVLNKSSRMITKVPGEKDVKVSVTMGIKSDADSEIKALIANFIKDARKKNPARIDGELGGGAEAAEVIESINPTEIKRITNAVIKREIENNVYKTIEAMNSDMVQTH